MHISIRVVMNHSNDINAKILISIHRHTEITKIPVISVLNLAEVLQKGLNNNCAKFQEDWYHSSREKSSGKMLR